MVINDFGVQHLAIFPTETDAPPIVDADAPLSGAVSLQRFQAIAGRRAEKVQGGRGIQLSQLALGNGAYRQPATRATPAKQGLSISIAK